MLEQSRAQLLLGPYIQPSHLTSHTYSIILQETLLKLLVDVSSVGRRLMWFRHVGTPVYSNQSVTNPWTLSAASTRQEGADKFPDYHILLI